MASLYVKFGGGLTALAVSASSTAAVPATGSRSSINAFVALSALASDASRTALCRSAASVPVGAGGVASTVHLPGTSCVVPVAHPAPIPVVKTSRLVGGNVNAAPFIGKEPPNAFSIGFPGVLVMLGLIAMLANSHPDDREPIGPF